MKYVVCNVHSVYTTVVYNTFIYNIFIDNSISLYIVLVIHIYMYTQLFIIHMSLPTSRPISVDLIDSGGAVLEGEVVALRDLRVYICRIECMVSVCVLLCMEYTVFALYA